MFSNNRLCISLEEDRARLLWGRAKRKHILVEGFGSLLLEQGLGESLDAGRLFRAGELIKEFAQREGWWAKRYWVVLNRKGVVARTVRVPSFKPRVLDSFLRNEMTNYLPVDPDDYISDYAILRRLQEGAGESYYEVFLAAVPRLQVEQVGMMAQAWEAALEAVEVAPRSILRLLDTLSCPDTMVLTLNEDGGFVMVTQNGGLLVHADLPFSDHDGFDPYMLAGEIRGYLDFYSSRNQGKTVEKVWLAGETGCSEEKLIELASILPVPLELLTPQKIGLNPGGSRGKEFSLTGCEFVPLVGLLLRKE